MRKEIFGYEIHYEKMNLFEKIIVNTMMKIKVDQSALSIEHIKEFAGEMSREGNSNTIG